MQYELHLFERDFTQLQQHAETSFPDEAVALLFGVISEKNVIVNRVELMENESETRRIAFSVNPESEYHLLVESEEQGECLVGIYHSHSAPPQPSRTDLRNMQLNPVVWLIASKLTGNWITKAYLLRNKNADEIQIKYRDSNDANP